MSSKQKLYHIRAHPGFWPVLLLVGLLATAVLAYALKHHDSTERMVESLLLEKATMLTTALESSLSARNRSGGRRRTEFLLQEMALRGNLQYIAVTTDDGTIIAHSDPRRIYDTLSSQGQPVKAGELAGLNIGPDIQGRILPFEDMDAFVSFKQFADASLAANASEQALFVFMGFDPEPLYAARDRDKQQTLLLISGALISACLLLLAVHLAQKAALSRRGLADAESLLETIVSNLSDGLLLMDAAGNIRRINTHARLFLGMDTHTPPPESLEALPQAILTPLKAFVRDGQPLPDSLEIELPEATKHLQVSAGWIQGEPGTADNLLLLLHDATQSKSMERELHRQDKLAAIGTLAAGVAHEVRNPLSSIKGYATYFGEVFADDPALREAARVMAGEADRLNRVISELINLARPASIEKKPVDITLLVQDCTTLLAQEALARNVTVGLHTAEGMPLLPLDADMMHQAVLNVCLNALEAMPTGGALDITLDCDTTHMLLTITDTGQGIAEQHLSRLFTPYFTTKAQGTGLGLSAVQKAVEAHGGSVRVASAQGRGTSVILHLPLGGC